MKELELLAPARNADIGIAAIDCGADAVYIAGPAFGARQAAGNPVEEVRRLCAYAHRFGARVFVTFNTILYEDELEEARRLFLALEEAGADAFIVQDLAVLDFGAHVPLHASTQCAIRTPEQARFYESLGFSRLVLERELSLEEVAAIRAAVSCELEFFVHGALCVCYSGNCYLSEYLAGRSANRGACVQACRSLYDLSDASGKVLLRDKALLSLRDYNLSERLEELAAGGICSFKIEGRLKNQSYVCNVVRVYSRVLDALVAAQPRQWRRASFGTVRGGFEPDLSKTFNRGYTQLYLDGLRGPWAAMDTPKGVGECIGEVASVRSLNARECVVSVRPRSRDLKLSSGDGFAVVGRDGITGFRGDVCEGLQIRCKQVSGLQPGAVLYRNLDVAFEKTLQTNRPERLLDVRLSLRPAASPVPSAASPVSSSAAPDPSSSQEIRENAPRRESEAAVAGVSSGERAFSFVSVNETEGTPAPTETGLMLVAETEDGRRVSVPFPEGEKADNQDRMAAILQTQLSKKTGLYQFRFTPQATLSLPLLPAARLNALRRALAEALDREPCRCRPLPEGRKTGTETGGNPYTYKANVSNSLASKRYGGPGEPAYEQTHRPDAELMRTRYCVRYELGLCPKHHGSGTNAPLFLTNQGRRLQLTFDCARCEMTVSTESQKPGPRRQSDR